MGLVKNWDELETWAPMEQRQMWAFLLETTHSLQSSPDASGGAGKMTKERMGKRAKLEKHWARLDANWMMSAIDSGETMLHWAALCRDARSIERFLAAGAKPCAKNKEGQEPLHWLGAAVSQKPWKDDPALGARCAAILIAGGANPDALDNKGRGPLHWAASFGETGVCLALLNAGADIAVKSKDGKTPEEETRWRLDAGVGPMEHEKEGWGACAKMLRSRAEAKEINSGLRENEAQGRAKKAAL